MVLTDLEQAQFIPLRLRKNLEGVCAWPEGRQEGGRAGVTQQTRVAPHRVEKEEKHLRRWVRFFKRFTWPAEKETRNSEEP